LICRSAVTNPSSTILC